MIAPFQKHISAKNFFVGVLMKIAGTCHAHFFQHTSFIAGVNVSVVIKDDYRNT